MDETEVTVSDVRSVGPDAIAVEFDAPEGFDAAPGQFVQVLADFDGEEVARFYTLSSPGVDDTFEVTVAIDPEGDLSPWLAKREPGDTVRVKGPFGNAYYEGEASVTVLAGGPGVGPAVGIGELAIDEGAEVAIVYRDEEPIQMERLDSLADAGASVRVLADGFEDAVADAVAAVDGQVFVYGFANFVEDAVDALTAAGVDPDEAKVESFGPAPDE